MEDKQFLRRSSYKVKRYAVLMKAAGLASIGLVTLISVVYFVSYMYGQYGSFTVSVNKYDMVKQGLTLSETGQFDTPQSRLNAQAVKEITNISETSISADVDQINGSHNGSNYIAYSFYLKNVGEDAVAYRSQVSIDFVTNDIDAAIRLRIYRNGQPTTYAKTRSDGSGPEEGTTAFLSGDTIVSEVNRNFDSGSVDKYTVVIWLEGNDPDCVDAIIGGRIKMSMQFSIAEA